MLFQLSSATNTSLILDNKGFDTLWRLLSGCLYSEFTAPCGLAWTYLFYTVLFLGLHIYSEFNTLELIPDLFGFIFKLHLLSASFLWLGVMNFYESMYIGELTIGEFTV